MQNTLKKSWMKEQMTNNDALAANVAMLFNLANDKLLNRFFFGKFSGNDSNSGLHYENDFAQELKSRSITAVKLQEKLEVAEEDSSEEIFTVIKSGTSSNNLLKFNDRVDWTH